MKKLSAVLLFVIMVLLLVPNVAVFAQDIENPYEIYVDATASDGGDGSVNHPFKTIQQAKEYIRTIDKADKSGIAVAIKSGFYYIDEPIVFGEEDSGTENCPITYYGDNSNNGNRPILSGGKIVEGSWRDEGNGIYSIPYDRDKKLRALYVNGQRCYMTTNAKTARGFGGYGSYSVSKDQVSWAWDDVEAYKGVTLNTKELDSNTRNPEDIELMTQTTWNTTIVCVDSLEKNGTMVDANLQMPYGAIAQNLTSSNAFKFTDVVTISNVFEWLDEEGEFYFDKSAKKLYYKKRANEDLNTAQVVVPNNETVIKIEGQDKEHQVKYLNFKTLKFAYTDWNLFEVAGSFGRATNQGAASMVALYDENKDGTIFHESIYRANDVGHAAIMVSAANNINFKDIVIAHTGNDGISMVNDVQDSSFEEGIIYDIAGTSMLIGHPQHMYIGDKGSSKGIFPDKEKYEISQEALCERLLIKNTYIQDIGVMFAGNPGVMIYAGKEITFEKNTLKNVPYSGISIGWGWWNQNGDDDSIVPGEAMDCLGKITIKNNAFYNCLTKLSDGGAIYTLGAMPDSIISENYIKDVAIGAPKPDKDKIRGIHLDEGTAGVYGEKNVIDIDPKYACVDCGLWGRQHDNDWDNNYSRTDRYSTWDWAPGCDVTNKHVSEDGNWGDEANAIIANAGISQDLMYRVEEEIPGLKADGKKINLALVISLSIAGAVALIGGIVAVYFVLKNKKQNDAKNEEKIA